MLQWGVPDRGATIAILTPVSRYRVSPYFSRSPVHPEGVGRFHRFNELEWENWLFARIGIEFQSISLLFQEHFQTRPRLSIKGSVRPSVRDAFVKIKGNQYFGANRWQRRNTRLTICILASKVVYRSVSLSIHRSVRHSSVNIKGNPCFLENQSKSRTISLSQSFKHEVASLALWALLINL